MDRREASRLLGVTEDVDLRTLKQRFRALARDHHPDRGGDPIAFDDLRSAYAILSEALTTGGSRPSAPLVSRGRPSRTEDDAVRIGWSGRAALDADARALLDRLERERAYHGVSRAPGARTNRFAPSLAGAAVSSLGITVVGDAGPDGRVTAHLTLTARTRPARRAVAGLDVARVAGAAWARRRGDAVTDLRATLPGRPDDEVPIERRATVAVVELLDALAWPLREWRAERRPI